MIRVRAQIFVNQPVFAVRHAMVRAIARRIYLKKFILFRKPEILKTYILDAAYQPTIEIVGLILAGIDI